MKTTLLPILFALALLLTGCSEDSRTASAELRDTQGNRVGTAQFTETPAGVRVSVHVSELAAGEYAFQIHEFARCQSPGFISAGAPYPPPEEVAMVTNASPALPRSLGKLQVDETGSAYADVIAPIVTLGAGGNSLFHEGGTALIIQEFTPTGATAQRVACGAISQAEGSIEEYAPEGDLESAGTPDNLGTPGKIRQPPQ